MQKEHVQYLEARPTSTIKAVIVYLMVASTWRTVVIPRPKRPVRKALHVPTECELFGAPGSGRLHVSEPQAASHWAVAEYTED